MPMTEMELAALVSSEAKMAIGGDETGSELRDDRAKNFRYYVGGNIGNEVSGRSKVIVRDVAEVVDNMIPSLLRLFASQENTVTIDPVGPEDLDLAKQETAILNHVFWKENNGFLTTYTYIKDALLQKNGFVTVLWEDAETVTREEYSNLLDVDLQQLDSDPELTPLEQEEVSEEVERPIVNPQTLQIEMRPTTFTTFNVVYERRRKRGRVVIENQAPEYCMVSNDATSTDLRHVRFVAVIRFPTRAALIEMGFDREIVMTLPSIEADQADNQEEIERKFLSDELTPGETADRLLQRVEVLDAYPMVDFDQDGVPERRQVIQTKAGSHILENREVDDHPLFTWTPVPLPHKMIGLCPADQARDIQEISSTLLRQMLDNLYVTNDPRVAIWEDAMGDSTMDDLLSPSVASPIRVTRPVGEALTPLAVPFTAGQSFPMLEWLAGMRKRRTGIGEGVAGLDVDSLKNIQTSVLAQAFDMAHMQIETIARIFAETGLKPIFRRIHELLRKHQDREKVVRIHNEFVPSRPQEWRERENLTVVVGLGTGTREQRLLHLQNLAGLQQAMAQVGLGNLVVTPQNAYNLGRSMAENALLPDPEMFFTDPQNQPAQDPATQQLAEAQQQIAQLQAQSMRLEMEKFRLEAEETMRRLKVEEERALTEAEKIRNQHEEKMTQLELEHDVNVPGAAV